ncbi:hypothetical protein C9I90_04075 [Photobacterium aphoticum]|uniref:Uncharacterized protein n=1 Tax=Photobacterium aphoticum TaxID=754436 RepID=A0A0J1GPL9_9GAMM|nr:hypothetical protein ABT58_04310 [Photobacterium aphoticum]PSU59258.1 hypothetical protein C9I90_04075 [Photobacterium aphoticum]
MSTFTCFHIGGSESAYSDSGLADTPVLYSQAETVKKQSSRGVGTKKTRQAVKTIISPLNEKMHEGYNEYGSLGVTKNTWFKGASRKFELSHVFRYAPDLAGIEQPSSFA